MKRKFSLQDIPLSPGVYVFRNRAGQVIYVGKAKSLRKRLSSYFQPSRRKTADPKLRALINSIDDFEFIVVKSEAEALLLESRLIKSYHPRYNVDLRDDKRFLLIAVNPSETYPRLHLVRIKKQDGRLYFGPFPNAGALRSTIDYLSRRFGLRTCSGRKPDENAYKHCMKQRVRMCSCPCVGKVSDEEYQQQLDKALTVLQGDVKECVSELEEEMRGYSSKLKFEDAAKIRDMIDNLKATCNPNIRRFSRTTLSSRRSQDGNPEGVKALQEALGIANAPEVVECYDISNIGGTLAVGSMSCFRNGVPSTKDYRRFRIKTVEGANDFAMIHEVIGRRFTKGSSVNRSELPDLVVIDGGPGQLNMAVKAMEEAEAPLIPIISLAKREEAIFMPGFAEPLILDRRNPALRLLQAVRDESHRFGVTYHRELRRKRIADSVLNEIEGVGEKRRTELLRAFKSVHRLKKASPEEMARKVPGLGLKLAESIHSYLNKR